ncbi:unnamed protein product, partial [Phaeothamnion confervicola]
PAEERGLLRHDLDPKAFQEHHNTYCGATDKAFAGETLGYVTPWNGAGYDFARVFAAKFDYISPCWYQLRNRDGDSAIVLTGGHDVDRDWMTAVRSAAAFG